MANGYSDKLTIDRIDNPKGITPKTADGQHEKSKPTTQEELVLLHTGAKK